MPVVYNDPVPVRKKTRMGRPRDLKNEAQVKRLAARGFSMREIKTLMEKSRKHPFHLSSIHRWATRS